MRNEGLKYVEHLHNDRARNSLRVLIVQAASTLLLVFGPFLLRRLMIREMGMEIVGLHSVFQTIANILSVSEMGFGQVMVFFLFEPLAKGDTKKVNALLAFMRKVYLWVGCLFIGVGVIISIFLPTIIKETSIPTNRVYVYYYLYIIAVSLSYFCHMEMLSLLNAIQRLDIHYIIAIILNLLVYAVQVCALIVFHSYALYLGVLSVQTVAAGVFRKISVKRLYPQFEPNGRIQAQEQRDIKIRVASVVGHQIDEKLLNSVDNIFISIFLGLNIVAVYGNYFYVVTAMTMIMGIVFNALLSAIGNAIVTETIESNYYRFECIFWLGSLLAGWATSCMLCMFQDFIRLWVGEYYLDSSFVILLCVYFYVSQLRKSVILFRNAAGMWYDDRYKPYVSMMVDVLLDIILINVMGLKGAIFSSIICVCFIEMPWETNSLFKNYFKKPMKSYITKMILYTSYSSIFAIILYYLCERYLNAFSYISLICKFLLCSFVLFVGYFFAYRKCKIYETWKETFKVLLLQ